MSGLNLTKITVSENDNLEGYLRVKENEKESIDIYFNKIIELGLGASIGGKLPDENFYYQK